MSEKAASLWVIDRKFDLLFFLCPILIGVLYFLSLLLAPGQAFLITAIVWVIFAQTHFGSTWFIYLDKKNLEYYNQHPFIYYVMPVVIFAAVLALGAYNQTLLIIIIAVASLWHVTKQNIGILQLYRMRNGEFSKFEKKTETFTIFAWTLFFGGFGALHLPHFYSLLGPLLPAANIVVFLFFLASVLGSIALIVQFFSRTKNSIPKNVFLLTSILMYSPYLYASVILVDIYQMEIATLTSLVAHYMQYLGLVWLINVNKYAGENEHAKRNHFLHELSRNKYAIVGAIMAYALLMAVFRWGVPAEYGFLSYTLPNVVIALTAIHFYIDSFIWRFRNPFVRETVLPYIKPATV